MGTRRRYSEEFKREGGSVSLAGRPEVGMVQVTSELGISADRRYNWIRASKESGERGTQVLEAIREIHGRSDRVWGADVLSRNCGVADGASGKTVLPA